MALQTSVRREERLGRAGALFDSSPIDTVTRTAEVAGFRPGELALRGTDPIHEGKGVRRLSAATAPSVEAITVHEALGVVRYLAARQLDPNATAEFNELDTLAILTKGRIWVEVEDDVLDGQQAFVRVVATDDERVGAWRADEDGGDALPITGIHFHGNSQDRDGVKLAVLFVDLG